MAHDNYGRNDKSAHNIEPYERILIYPIWFLHCYLLAKCYIVVYIMPIHVIVLTISFVPVTLLQCITNPTKALNKKINKKKVLSRIDT